MERSNPKKIQIKAYNYDLPDHKIAKYPLSDRSASKLLVYQDNSIKSETFKDIGKWIPPTALVIFNNTKVIQARIIFYKSTGARIEIFCLEPYLPKDYFQIFEQNKTCSWICLVGNSKKWKEGELITKLTIKGQETVLKAYKENLETPTPDANVIRFEWNSGVAFADILDEMGELPIPPYLHRDTEESDKTGYQTVYSKIKGSVAAPTAGLHFTPDVLKVLDSNGTKLRELTLHVGAGTFKPVKTENIGDHPMHAELISVKKSLIEEILEQKKQSKPVIAVGTTSVRTLESLYYLGILINQHPEIKPEGLFVNQWIPYELENENLLSVEKSFNEIIRYLERNDIESLIARTEIIIAPGFSYKIVNGIITNFHQPQSTLLLLVSAFVGENNWKKIYGYALKNDYRFLSYGDSSFLFNT